MDTSEIDIKPFEEAVEALSKRTSVGSALRSAEWDKVPAELRVRAMFSARVESARVVQIMKDKLLTWSKIGREDPSRSLMSAGKFVAEMRQALGAKPGDSGRITDITSYPRLQLIWDTQTTMAQEYGRWKMGNDEDLLDAFPAREFLRVESRKEPREDWPERWQKACAEAGDDSAMSVFEATGRMVALRDSGVWVKLSRFDVPWPPFDYGSGMGVEDVPMEEAQELGLIEPGESVEPGSEGFNDNATASVAGLDGETREWLKESFGEQIEIDGDEARWHGEE